MPGKNLFAEGAAPVAAGRNLFAAPQPEFVGPPAPTLEDAQAEGKIPGTVELGYRMGLSMLPPWMRGVGETAMNVGSSMVATPINEVAKGMREQYEQPVGQDIVPTYQPRTEEGKLGTAVVGTVMKPVSSAIDWAAEIDNPDPAIRATGHYLKAALGVAGLRAPIGKATEVAAPALADLKNVASKAYETARSTAGIVPQGKLGELAGRAEKVLADEGATATNEPHAIGSYQQILDEATKRGVDGHSFQGLESLRRTLMNSENAAQTANDARLAGKLVDEFDEWADKLKPEDMVAGAGDPEAAMAAFKEGRAAWVKVKKAQTIDAMVEKAQNNAGNYSQSGLENSLRRQFVQLANNPARMRQFSPAEQAAIHRIVRPSVGGRITRGLGKFAIRGPVTGGLEMAMGPGAGMALAGIGEAGRLASTILMENKVGALSELVRGGQKAPPGPGLLDRQNLAPAAAVSQDQQ